jgi:hypothetical protein
MKRFSLRVLLLVAVLLCVINACRPASSPSEVLGGRWVGTIGFRGRMKPLRIDFHGSPGNWTALAGRPDASDSSIPVLNVRYENSRLLFELKDGGARLSFEGSRRGDVIKGTGRVGEEGELTFELRRTGDAPAPPSPLQEEPVRFSNGDTILNGTLVLPPGAGPHPAIVLIHGSGRQTRDDWRLIGMFFARNGIAALLYDKRDVGHEPSGMDLVGLEDLAGDALAAVSWLKSRADIRADRVGLWGISQGGMVAPMVAAQSSDVAFVIAVSAPGVSYADLNAFAVGNRLRGRGFSEAEVAEAQTALRRLDDFVRRGNDPTGTEAMLKQLQPKPWFRPATLPSTLPTEKERQTWVRWRNLDLDPSSYWERVRVPVLLIYGERDAVVPVSRSVERITAALGRAGNSRALVKVFPDADHELVVGSNAKGEGSNEAEPQPRDAPGYFEILRSWTQEQVRLPR